MNSLILINSFKEVGLSRLEAEIYLLLLGNKDISITNISSNLSVNRVKVYESLKKLEKFDLLKRGGNYSKIINLEPPTRVIAMLKHKENQTKTLAADLEEIVPELMISYEYLNKNPKVKIYEGVGQMTRLLLQHLEEVETEILWLNEGEDLNALFGSDYFYTEYSQRRAKKGINTRILANTNNITIKKYQPKEAMELRKVRFLPPQYQSPGTITIFNSKIIMWNTHIPRAVVINDSQLAQVQRDLFETVWSQQN